MHSTIMVPTVGTFVGFIVEPIDVRTMDIHIPMEGITADISLIPTEEDIILTPMEGIVRTISDLIVGMCVEFTAVHIDGVITNAMGRH